MNKTTLECVGYHLDVVSLARSSMTSKLWKTAFGNHRLWQIFYGEKVPDKNANYRILYGERLNRSSFLINGLWKITKIDPPPQQIIMQCFKIDDKIAFIANGILFLNPMTKVNLPYKIDDTNVPCEDGGFVYMSKKQICGKILRWKKDEFPNSPEVVYESNSSIEQFNVKNGVIYLCEGNEHQLSGVLGCTLRAIKPRFQQYWETKLKRDVKGAIQVNDYIGGALESKKHCLHVWDINKKTEPNIIYGGVDQFALLHNEAICLNSSGIFAYGLDHHREIMRENFCFQNDLRLLVDTDREEIFVLASSYLIWKHGKIEFAKEYFIDAKVFNGIIYATNQMGSLLLIHPKKGIISKGEIGMFGNQDLNVYKGMILGANRDHGVIVQPGEPKATKKKKFTLSLKCSQWFRKGV